MEQTESQNKTLLRLMKQGKKITAFDALRDVGCMRLGARISELRRDGHPIADEWIESNGKRFKRYFI